MEQRAVSKYNIYTWYTYKAGRKTHGYWTHVFHDLGEDREAILGYAKLLTRTKEVKVDCITTVTEEIFSGGASSDTQP